MPLYIIMVMFFPFFSLLIRKIFNSKICFVLECLYLICNVLEIMLAIRNEDPLLLYLMTKLYRCMIIFLPLFVFIIHKWFSSTTCIVLELLYVIFLAQEILLEFMSEDALLSYVMTNLYFLMIIFLPLFSFLIRKLFSSNVCFFLELLYVIFLANEIILKILIEETLLSNVMTVKEYLCVCCFWMLLIIPSYYTETTSLARRYKLDPKQLAILLELLHVTFGILLLYTFTWLFISEWSWCLYWYLCFLPKYLKMNNDTDDNFTEDSDKPNGQYK